MMNDKDLKIRWFSGSGAGGQHRNRTTNCCEVTHLPTGIKCQSTAHRSREANRKAALAALRSALGDERQLALERRLQELRKAAMERGRIRTYDFKSGLVRCHISNRSFDLSSVLNGELEEVMDAGHLIYMQFILI